jgi:hypothetical protein
MFNCTSIEKDELDVSRFEEDNPDIAVDIYYIPTDATAEVKLIYRSKNQKPKYQVASGVLEDENNVHYVIIRKLSELLNVKNKLKNGEGICHWCKGKFRYNNGSFDKHLLSCKQREVEKSVTNGTI